MSTKKKIRKKKNSKWFVYILKCGDGSFYTGAAIDPVKRSLCHQSGKGGRYTRSRLPVELIYQESCPNKSLALKREYVIKQLPRALKKKLIK